MAIAYTSQFRNLDGLFPGMCYDRVIEVSNPESSGEFSMSKSVLIAVATLCLLPGAASAEVPAFQANFDLDPVGEAPNSDPPGEPDGDIISLRTQGGPITVEESVGSITGQPVLMDRQETGYFSLTAVLDEDYWYCNHYTIRWRSASRDNLFFYACAAYSANSMLLSGLEYRQSYVLSFNSVNNPLPVGYQIDTMQEFVMTLNMVDKTTSLLVDGMAYPEAQDMSQVQVYGDGLKVFSFSPGGLDPSQFVVDDIEITADCADTAVAPATWSRVKSLYR